MARGDIEGRLTLNSNQYFTRMEQAVNRTQQFAERMRAAFGGSISLPKLDVGKVDSRGINEAASATRELGATSAQTAPRVRSVGEASQQAGRKAAGSADGYQVAANALDRLRQVGTVLVAGGFLRGLFVGLRNNADEAARAAASNRVYINTLERLNLSQEEGDAVVTRIAERFGLLKTQVREAAIPLLKVGLDFDTVAKTLEAGGASAASAGFDIAQGMRNVAIGVATGRSELLETSGVIVNASEAWATYARELGVSTGSLTANQKAQAYAQAVYKESVGDIADLAAILNRYRQSQAALTKESTAARESIGGLVQQGLTPLNNLLAKVLQLFNAAPAPLKNLAIVTGLLVTVTTALGVAYVSLRALLINQTVLGPIVNGLLKNEAVLRSRAGAGIIVQAKAYGILDKAQVRSAVTSRNAAIANAAAVGSLGKLTGALKLLGSIKGFLAIGILIVILREAAKYTSVLAPLFAGVSKQLQALGQAAPVKRLLELVGSAERLQKTFSEGVLNAVTLVSLALAGLGLRIEQAGARFQYLSDLVSKGPAQATKLLEQRLTALDTKYGDLTDSILDNALAHQTQIRAGEGAAAALTLTADAATNATSALTALSDEERATFTDFKKRADEVNESLDFSLDNGELANSVQSATAEIDALVTDIRAKSRELEKGSPLRYLLTERELGLLRGRAEVVKQVYADAVYQAQSEAAQSTVDAMAEGTAKIQAGYNLRREAERKAFADLTEGLETDSQTYIDLKQAFDTSVASLNTQEATDLQAQAQERLNAARDLREQIDQVAADLAQSQAEGSDDALVGIRAQFARNADGIRADTQKLLRDVEQARQQQTISDAEAAAETVRISNLQTTRLGQNERELSEAVQAETRRRANFVADQYSAIRSYEAAYTAERQRSQGDELGAVKTELGERLRLIDEGLRRELQQEGLTRAQITAITQKAEADRVQSRVEAGRQIDDVMRDEVARERAFQNELRSVRQQDTIDAAQDAGQVRAAAAAEYEKSVSDLRASLAEQLAAVGVSETEKTEIRRVAQAKRASLDAAYGRTLAQLAEDEAQVVAAAAETAQRTRIDAVTGSLPRLIRQFGLEQAARLKADRESLDAFEGTQQQRQQLVAATAQREAAYAKKLAVDLLKEQRAALQAYQTAYLEAETQIREARETSAQEALTAAQKVTDFGGQRLDRRAFRDEQGAYDTLQKTLQANVQGSAEVADAARVRARSASATADDVGALVAAENAYVAAQGRVVDATQAQIDRLKGLQNAQFEIVRGGSDVLAFADAASKITGRDPERGRITTFINEQQDALVSVLQQQERNNVPLREQLATLQEIAGLEDRLRQGGQRGLSAEQVTYIDERQAELLSSYPGEAAKALQSSADIGQQLRTLSTELGDAQEKFTTLLGSVSQSSVLELSVQIDDREIRAGLLDAQTALQETFGEAAAARISERFAAGLSLGQILKTETDNATSRVRAQFDEAGGASGKGFMAAFAEGISGSGNLVEQALERVLRPVRELLPSSDAKRGPLSDLTFSGGKTVTTYAGGLERKLPDLARVVTKMAATVKPLSAVSTLQLLPGTAGAGGGGGGDQHNYYLGDGMIPVDDLTRMDGARFGHSLMHTLKNRTRMGHRPPLRGGRRF